jgi:hypothetical protein
MNLIPLLLRVCSRLRLTLLLRGAGAGGAAALGVLLALRPEGVGAQLALLAIGILAGGAIQLGFSSHRDPGLRRAAVRTLEAGVPESRNLIFTAHELLEGPKQGPEQGMLPADPIRARILSEADRVTKGVEPRGLVPVRRPLAGVGAVLAGWLVALWVLAGAPGNPISLPAGVPGGPGTVRSAPGELEISIRVFVTPPAYLGLPVATFEDPERIEVIEGSEVEVEVEVTVRAASGAALASDALSLSGAALERVEGRMALDRRGEGPEARFVGRFVAESDGFLAVDAWRGGSGVGADGGNGVRAGAGEAAGAGAAEVRRLIGLAVRPDRLPDVRVELPGEDLRVADGNRVVSVVVEAEDDFGLTTLELRYTRVTGFGELFTFEEGRVPLEIERESPRRWVGRAAWDLAPLMLERGDLVVYRAVARDARPGDAEGESDTWAVEVVSPDAVAVAGGGSEEDFDRYALSQ